MDGDARFLSHRDVMRLWSRAAVRAGLSMAYSQGFNPHPKVSLPAPRPVGVASRCELAVLHLASPPAQSDWAEGLDGQLPPGMRVLRAAPAPGRRAIQPKAITYELPLRDDESGEIVRRIAHLTRQDRWEVARPIRTRRRDRRNKTLDIKPRVVDTHVVGGRLTFTLLSGTGGSARPAEVLALLGMDEPDPAGEHSRAADALSRLVRTRLACDSPPDNTQTSKERT